MQKRSYQTRYFNTMDKTKVMRVTVSTFQVPGFIVNQANFTLGSVTATKMNNRNTIKATVTVREKGKTQEMVRANARRNAEVMAHPKNDQDFFVSLEKSLYLTAHAGE